MSGRNDRFSPPDPQNYSPQQTEVAADIAGGPRGGVRGPLAMWLHRPDLAARAQSLGAYCRYGSSLSPRLSELAILITALHWQADYEWAAHEGPAIAAGLDPARVSVLKSGADPEFTAPDEAALYHFVTEILTTRRVTDDTYAAMFAELGQDGLIDLVGILGYYALISTTINVFEIPAAPGTGFADG